MQNDLIKKLEEYFTRPLERTITVLDIKNYSRNNRGRDNRRDDRRPRENRKED